MPAVAKRTVILSADQADYVNDLVAAGSYASPAAVVGAGLDALRERDLSVEQWLCEEVVPVYDAMQAEPGRGLSADAVLDAIDARHAARLRAAKSSA
jgi:antitoxin ParD1/3/4